MDSDPSVNEYQHQNDDELAKSILDLTDDSFSVLVPHDEDDGEDMEKQTPRKKGANAASSKMDRDLSNRPASTMMFAPAILVDDDPPSQGDQQSNTSTTLGKHQVEAVAEPLKFGQEQLQEEKEQLMSDRKRRTKYLLLALISLVLVLAVVIGATVGTRDKSNTKSEQGQAFKSFESNDELRRAVDAWLSGQDTSDSEFAATYGYPIGQWDVSSITDFSNLFDACNPVDCNNFTGRNGKASTFNEDISSWNVSSAKSMAYMFVNADSFDGDMSQWEVSKVTQMKGMFGLTSAFSGIGVGSWNVSGVVDMFEMFSGAVSFDQDLSSWDVSSVTEMSYMFFNAIDFTGAGLNGWNVSNVKAMSSMFAGASTFNQDLSTWTVSKVESMDSMFQYADNFEGIGLSSWVVSQVKDMSYMFSNMQFFNGTGLAAWDVSSVANISGMFFDATSFDQDLCAWGSRLPNFADVSDAFQGTSCPNQTDPDLDASPPGPFCYDCF